jgi:predicted RNase H-like HicB family nuclease
VSKGFLPRATYVKPKNWIIDRDDSDFLGCLQFSTCIHTEGETMEELRENVREAVDCYFDETMEAPRHRFVAVPNRS